MTSEQPRCTNQCWGQKYEVEIPFTGNRKKKLNIETQGKSKGRG